MKDSRTNAFIAGIALVAAVLMMAALSYAIGKWSFGNSGVPSSEYVIRDLAIGHDGVTFNQHGPYRQGNRIRNRPAPYLALPSWGCSGGWLREAFPVPQRDIGAVFGVLGGSGRPTRRQCRGSRFL